MQSCINLMFIRLFMNQNSLKFESLVCLKRLIMYYYTHLGSLLEGTLKKALRLGCTLFYTYY